MELLLFVVIFILNDQPFLLSAKSDIHHVSVEFPNTSWTHCITKAIPNYDHPFTMLCVLD